jgi:Fe-S cluster biogenesis protein NfuA/nitrite reductase/ring-hydroxylating ferredoxin subunit
VPEERRAELAEDGVVASVLLAHDLYPVPLEERVREALEEVRPYLESHDGGIQLLGIEDGVAQLRLEGSCDGCGASFATLEAAVEQALRAHAPDLDGMDVEGAVAAPPERPPPSSAEWVVLPVNPTRGEVAAARGLMVANVAGTLLAYRDWCAGCPAPLSSGMLVGGTLTCTACGRSYDLPRAGREKDGDLQLEPVPLLRSGGQVKVSLPASDSDADGAAAHGDDGHCELCPVGLSERHQHLLNLVERRIVCVCATCWSLHSGDPEYRATGGRTLWLDDFALDDEAWSGFQIPIGLAFMMKSGLDGEMVTLYPSPAGVTEAELDALAWTRMSTDNPVLEDLVPDAEALIINRLADPPQHVIAPLDECYRLVGMIKSRWSGISGGPELTATVDEFFGGLRETAIAA